MTTLKLNNSIVQAHKSIAIPVNLEYKSKYDRQKYRWQECMFLTQGKGVVTYTTCTPYCAIQNYQLTDHKLPNTLAINLQSVPYNTKDKEVILEIPKCTLETLNTFYDPNRPQYIRSDDLQTKIIAINGRRANVEYINPNTLMDSFNRMICEATQNPIYDYTKYNWFSREANGFINYALMSKIYKMVFGNSVFEYEYLRYPGDTTILKRIDELHSAVSRYGMLTRRTENDCGEYDTHQLPIAIFENNNRKIIWSGFAEKIR